MVAFAQVFAVVAVAAVAAGGAAHGVVSAGVVGEDEADVGSGKISVASPIARAIMGKHEGDAVVVNAPAGDVEFEIESVCH